MTREGEREFILMGRVWSVKARINVKGTTSLVGDVNTMTLLDQTDQSSTHRDHIVVGVRREDQHYWRVSHMETKLSFSKTRKSSR